MSKPVKGNKVKRPPSDDRRLEYQHIKHLKRKTAILSFIKDKDMFKVTKLSNNKVRIKGVGAQAYKLSKGNSDVVTAIKNKDWKRVALLVPFVPKNLDYTSKKKSN